MFNEDGFCSFTPTMFKCLFLTVRVFWRELGADFRRIYVVMEHVDKHCGFQRYRCLQPGRFQNQQGPGLDKRAEPLGDVRIGPD